MSLSTLTDMHLVTCALLPVFINGMLLASGQVHTSKLQQTLDTLRHQQNTTADLVASLSSELHSIKAEMRYRESELGKVESELKTIREENILLRHHLNSTSGCCDVNSTSGVYHDLNNDVTVLKDDVTLIKAQLGLKNSGESNSSVTSIVSELTELRSEISSSVTNETSDLKQSLTNMMQRLEALEANYANSSGSLMAQSTSIFYQVYLNPDITVNNNGALIFDTVTANVGNGYDVKTGIFTAPVEGKYLLWANVLAQSHTDAVLDVFLLKNGHSISASYSKVPFMMGYNTASLMTIAHLKAGDTIQYQLLTSIMITGKDYSNYGGVLLP